MQCSSEVNRVIDHKPFPIHKLPGKCLMRICTYSNAKDMHALVRLSSAIAKQIFTEEPQQYQQDVLHSLIFRVLRSSLAEHRVMSYREYRMCNTEMYPTRYSLTEDGERVRTNNLKKMGPKVYAEYKLRKLASEKEHLGRVFPTVLQLDWRGGCCKKDEQHQEIQTVKGPITLYWKALKGIVKYKGVTRLMIRAYTGHTYKDYAFRGESLKALLDTVLRKCAERMCDKVKCFEKMEEFHNLIDALFERAQKRQRSESTE